MGHGGSLTQSVSWPVFLFSLDPAGLEDLLLRGASDLPSSGTPTLIITCTHPNTLSLMV